MNSKDRSEINTIKSRLLKELPEGTNLLFATIALSEIITEFSELVILDLEEVD